MKCNAKLVMAVVFSAALSITALVHANPTLVPGVWTSINPPNWPFAGSGSTTSFGNGLAVDQNNPSILYFCTDNFNPVVDGIYKSTNGGSSWARVGLLDEPLRVRIDPNNSQHLYAGDGVRGATGGFWVSNDGGATWAKPQGWINYAQSSGYLIDDVYDIAVDPVDFNHVLVSSHSPYKWDDPVVHRDAGILETKDGGSTWTVHLGPEGMGYGHGIWFLKNNGTTWTGLSTTWLWGTQGNGFWRTSNSGSTWTKVSTQNMTHGGGQSYYSSNNILYTACLGPNEGFGILRSTNSGVSWTGVSPVRGCNAVGGDGTYIYAHTAYGGGISLFYRSLETDGITWTPMTNAGSFDNGPFEYAFDSRNGILYASSWSTGMQALKVGTSTQINQALSYKIKPYSPVKKSFTLMNGKITKEWAGKRYDVRGSLVGIGR